MNTKRWMLLAAMFVLMVGCAQEPAEVESTATPIPDETLAPSPTLVRTGVTVLADGVVQPAQPALPLAFETGGRLLAVHVRAGDLVQAGDLIATLDNTHAQRQVAEAQLGLRLAELELENLTREASSADVAAAEASVASAQANLNALFAGPTEYDLQSAKLNVDAAKDQLYAAQAQRDAIAGNPHAGGAEVDAAEAGVLSAEVNVQQAILAQERLTEGASQAEVSQARSQLAAAQAALDALLAGASPKDLAAAEINVEQARLALASALRELVNAELMAPISGTVTAVQAAPGTLVGGGAPIVALLDMTQLEFHTTNLSERDLAQIFPGQAAVVTLKAYPNDPIEATVGRIGLQAGAAVGDAATFPVILVLSETDLDIRPGMTGRAEIRYSRE